jgi:hypothetical protein
MKAYLIFMFVLAMAAVMISIACDEGDVTVNTPSPAPPDSSGCDTVLVYADPETVWVDCPAETVWADDPFWACVKECEGTGFNRNSRMYRDCMESCLSELN